MTVSEIVKKMIDYSKGNLHDINHFMKVYAYAKVIGECENLDKETQTIKSEGKLIDSSELLNNPYQLIVQYLIDGPQNENLQSVFPEKTRIIDAKLEKNCVILNFSEEILNYQDDTQKYNMINCILNSLTQLNEVNSIKFTINGETKNQLNEEYCEIR